LYPAAAPPSQNNRRPQHPATADRTLVIIAGPHARIETQGNARAPSSLNAIRRQEREPTPVWFFHCETRPSSGSRGNLSVDFRCPLLIPGYISTIVASTDQP